MEKQEPNSVSLQIHNLECAIKPVHCQGGHNIHMIEEACELAKEVQANAYCPYSEYPVGAGIVVSTNQGPQVVGGCNVENASFGLCQCAERSAVCTAVALFGEIEIQCVAIITKDGGTPCGACRQVIHEFASDDCKVICMNQNGDKTERSFRSLLPEAFESDEI